MRTLTFAAATSASLLLAPVAQAADYSFTLAYIPVKGTNYVEVIEALPERIAKATGGKVEIKVNPSLIGGPKLASAVRDGQVEMSAVLNGYLSATEPRLGLQNLPGLIETLEDYRAVYEAFWGADMAEVWREEFNAEPLLDSVFCPQALISVEPIDSLEAFEGKKIRVHNTETARLVDALGAKPTSIPAAEVLPALDRKVIDGVFTASCWAFGQGFGTVAKHVTDWHVASIQGWTLLMNETAWQGLPANLQEAIRAEMAAIQAEEFEGYAAEAAAAAVAWEAAGVTYSDKPKSETAALFSEAYVAPVYQAWQERAEEVGLDGAAYIQRAREALPR